jgi:hypothetical protein
MSTSRSNRGASTANALRNADDVSARLSNTRTATMQAVELTERALRSFKEDETGHNGGRGGARAGAPLRYVDDNDGDADAALTSLVRQLESFSEKRTGASRGGKGSGGGRADKWSTRSIGGGDDDIAGGDENSLVGYSIMYGSTVDDGASVADMDDLQSEYSVDLSTVASTRNREHGTIDSVNGRISAVSDSLNFSKQRLNESIAALEAEVGATNDFEQFKDDGMPVVGNTKTGQPVIDMFASENAATRKKTVPAAEYSPMMKSLTGFFGCCSTRGA